MLPWFSKLTQEEVSGLSLSPAPVWCWECHVLWPCFLGPRDHMLGCRGSADLNTGSSCATLSPYPTGQECSFGRQDNRGHILLHSPEEGRNILRLGPGKEVLRSPWPHTDNKHSNGETWSFSGTGLKLDIFMALKWMSAQSSLQTSSRPSLVLMRPAREEWFLRSEMLRQIKRRVLFCDMCRS